MNGMVKRLFLRTVIFLVFTIAAFAATELIIHLSKNKIADIGGMFPEVMRVLVAVGILAWAEISIMWMRIFLTPKIDIQKIALLAEMGEGKSAGLMYCAHQFTWAVRMCSFLYLYAAQ